MKLIEAIEEHENAFVILYEARKLARENNWPEEKVQRYLKEAKGSSYANLVKTTNEYFKDLIWKN